jgi:hypothetical protein
MAVMTSRGRERGGCLSAFLVFVIVIEAIRLLVGLFASFSDGLSETQRTAGLALVASGAVGLCLAVQVLRWRRWAVTAWCIFAVVGVFVALAADVPWPLACAPLIGLALFIVLVAPVWAQFDGEERRRGVQARSDEEQDEDAEHEEEEDAEDHGTLESAPAPRISPTTRAPRDGAGPSSSAQAENSPELHVAALRAAPPAPMTRGSATSAVLPSRRRA